MLLVAAVYLLSFSLFLLEWNGLSAHLITDANLQLSGNPTPNQIISLDISFRVTRFVNASFEFSVHLPRMYRSSLSDYSIGVEQYDDLLISPSNVFEASWVRVQCSGALYLH